MAVVSTGAWDWGGEGGGGGGGVCVCVEGGMGERGSDGNVFHHMGIPE